MQVEQSEIEGKLNQLTVEVEKAESLLSRSLCFSISSLELSFCTIFFYLTNHGLTIFHF